MSILKSTNSGAQQRLTIDYLKELGFEMRGREHIVKYYDWGEDINDSNEDVGIELEIDWTGSTSRPDDYNLIGKLFMDFKGNDGATYVLTSHFYLETIQDFLIYKRGVIKKIPYSDDFFDSFRKKSTTYTTINLKQ